MASTNQSPEYQAAEKKYLNAQSDEERLDSLKQMMSYMPQHKAGESMRANLRLRYKRLKEKLELAKKKKKSSSKPGIKKEGIQAVIIGLTNSGKSSLLSILTNAKPEINNLNYTTQQPIIGMLDLDGIKFQIIYMPAVNHDTFDQGTANVADILLIIITNLRDLEKILPYLNKTTGKRIILFNKSDLLDSSEKRKIQANLQSKRYNFCIISCKTHEGIDVLKNKFIENSNVLRIYTKQPGKKPDTDPVLIKPGSTVEKLAKKVFHSDIKIKETRITGPSSKFPNQTVGLKHILKDKDIVEFHTE